MKKADREKVRLYFTKEKRCIGSYDEIHKYETETGQSYYGSDYYYVPDSFNPVNKLLGEVEEAHRRYLKSLL